MRSTRTGVLLAAAVSLSLGQVRAQNAPAASAELKTGPATIAKHWSKYGYPETIPEGVSYYIIQRGDTLWDLSARFLKTPFLWPQLWEQNKYIKDAHWIYPGDPLVLKKIEVIAEGAGQTPAMPAATQETGGATTATDVREVENPLYPATEELLLQCAPRLVKGREDDAFRIVGSEHGAEQFTYSERNIIYLNKGSNAGVKAGDVYTVSGRGYKVKHPKTGKELGRKLYTKGWVRVILVQETSSTAVVERSCDEMYANSDYLRPFEKVAVPLLIRRPPPDRMTPPSGKAAGYVVDIGMDNQMAGTGDFVRIDLGASTGMAPGNTLTVYRIVYPKVPTGRHVLGELAVLTVQDSTALAKVMYSVSDIRRGDEVELR